MIERTSGKIHVRDRVIEICGHNAMKRFVTCLDQTYALRTKLPKFGEFSAILRFGELLGLFKKQNGVLVIW